MTSPILLTQGLTKVFTRGLFMKASNTALKDVSLCVERGRTLVMLGQSGSGKTTFARLAARLMKPSDGKIVFDGRDITGLEGEELRNIRKELQIVFQDPYSSLDGMKTVHRLLSEALESHYSMSPSEVEDRCRSILAECALQEDILPRKVDQFSGGQRQRIALARSLILSPSFLIADEITSALDVVTQEGIVDMLLERQEKEGLSMLFITHDIDLARWIGDDVAILYAGHLVEAGDADEVLKHPAHPYTNALIAGHPAKHGPRPQEGCPYAPSCPYSTDQCRRAFPQEMMIGRNHRATCLLLQ